MTVPGGTKENTMDLAITYEIHVFTAPNVVVEWLTLLIREVPGSNFCPEVGYPD
jgi:hypothetical protein